MSYSTTMSKLRSTMISATCASPLLAGPHPRPQTDELNPPCDARADPSADTLSPESICLSFYIKAWATQKYVSAWLDNWRSWQDLTSHSLLHWHNHARNLIMVICFDCFHIFRTSLNKGKSPCQIVRQMSYLTKILCEGLLPYCRLYNSVIISYIIPDFLVNLKVLKHAHNLQLHWAPH